MSHGADDQVLLFRLGGKPYGIGLSGVEALSPPGPIRRVRSATEGVLGLTEWRGKLLTVIDLTALLGREVVDTPESLVHLSAPFAHIALYVAGPVKLANLQAGPSPEPITEDGVAVRMILPSELMDRVLQPAGV